MVFAHRFHYDNDSHMDAEQTLGTAGLRDLHKIVTTS